MIYRVVVRESQKVVYRVEAESADEAQKVYEGWGDMVSTVPMEDEVISVAPEIEKQSRP